MNRKTFVRNSVLASTGLLLGGCGDSETSAERQKHTNSAVPLEWRMATVWEANFPVIGECAHMFSKWVSEMSQQRLRIAVFGTGELCGGLEIFDQVSAGKIEFGCGCSNFWEQKSPAFPFFTAIPFGMNARMLNSWLLGGEQVGYNFWKELYGQYNLVPFLGGNTGIQMAGWSNRLIEKVEDLKGLKVRVPGYGGRTLAAFEGEQVLVLPENICSGLTDGTINFAEWIGPYQDYKANMHKVAKYYYTPGWHEPSGQLEFFCNKTKYDYLPEDLQTIIDTAALRVQNWMLAEFDSRNLDYLSIIEDSGVKLKSFPKPLLKALKEVATDLIKKATEKDPLAARIYESYMGFMAEHNTWEETVDREFYGDVMSAEL